MVAVDTGRASPFAQSLLFGWIGVYMYEGDAPLAERRAAALALDRDLLRELLGDEELRELLDPQALVQLELELQGLAEDRLAHNPDDLDDLFRRVGELTAGEIAARSAGDPRPWLEQLEAQGRTLRVTVAGEERFASPDSSMSLSDRVMRYARTHGPFLTTDVASRLGASHSEVADALGVLERDGRVVRGEFRPGGAQREWCDVDVLRALRRRSLARLRKEVEPVDSATLGRFLPAWQGLSPLRQGPDALVEAIAQLQGAAVPASILESDVLPTRVSGYRPADLDTLCASGELVWVGAGPLGDDDGRVTLFFRDRLRVLAPRPPDARPAGAIHDAIRIRLAERGASFWPDVVDAAGTADESLVLNALWDMVWAGEITNDTLAPLRSMLSRRPRAHKGKPRPGALRRVGPPAGAGRWSLVASLLASAPSPTEIAHARASQLLERHGVVTREAVLAENVPGGFAGVYSVLRVLEEAGRVRRGYFVAGLGAAQFALPGAVDRLRDMRSHGGETLAISAADPAQPYGAALAWPDSPGRPSRAAGAYAILAGGSLAAFVERGGRSLLTFSGEDDAWVDALVSLVKEGRARKLDLQRIDGQPAHASPLADRLRTAGFADGYRGLVLRT